MLFITSFHASNCKLAQQSLFILNQECYTNDLEWEPRRHGSRAEWWQAYSSILKALSAVGELVKNRKNYQQIMFYLRDILLLFSALITLDCGVCVVVRP